MGNQTIGRWLVLAAAAGAPLLTGCAPANPTLFDAAAIRASKRVVVLPLADAPGPGAKGAGKVVAGVATGEFARMGRFSVLHVSDEALKSALSKTGLALEDCYDPGAAAVLGAELGADAVLCGELVHYGTQQEHSTTTVMIVGAGGTSTTHWVSLNLRLVHCAAGKIVYTGTGTASSPEGYSPATAEACKQSFAALKYLLEQAK